jgi:hypothetical protein
MREDRVLVLIRPAALARLYVDSLRQFNIDKVRSCDEPKNMPWGQLAGAFNALVIDAVFSGNARDTAALVRRIRREFFEPILAVQHCMTNEGVFPLQVAGCNFVIEEDTDSIASKFSKDIRIIRSVCFTLDTIGAELDQPHQKT